ncbi:MAG: universal stress protein [Gemmatimonadota bacterium]|nr:universal stress protein [Gemmatimonadota bacterium]
MYQRILVPVEHTEYDEVILAHVRKLAVSCGGASIILIHVADGWAARNIKELHLRESEEMRSDHEYIERIADDLESEGFKVEALLAGGDPAKEIAAAGERERCDLIAMATHGHRGLADVLRGSVANELRHISMLPVLMVRGSPAAHAHSPC